MNCSAYETTADPEADPLLLPEELPDDPDDFEVFVEDFELFVEDLVLPVEEFVLPVEEVVLPAEDFVDPDDFVEELLPEFPFEEFAVFALLPEDFFEEED